MELKVNAINIRSVDYKDNDKMLTLFSLEKGLMSAGIKGVKKAGAKLAFASQPFCFAEYILNEGNGRRTVTGATEIESFYNLRLNLSSFYGASCINEFLIKCAEEDNGDERLFVLTVNTLKRLNFGKENAKLVVGEFLIEALDILGYRINCKSCAMCGKDNFESEFAYFDFDKGVLICENCLPQGATRIRGETARSLKNLVLNKPVDEENLNYVLKFLNYYLEQKAGVFLKCINELLMF